MSYNPWSDQADPINSYTMIPDLNASKGILLFEYFKMSFDFIIILVKNLLKNQELINDINAM